MSSESCDDGDGEELKLSLNRSAGDSFSSDGYSSNGLDEDADEDEKPTRKRKFVSRNEQSNTYDYFGKGLDEDEEPTPKKSFHSRKERSNAYDYFEKGLDDDEDEDEQSAENKRHFSRNEESSTYDYFDKSDKKSDSDNDKNPTIPEKPAPSRSGLSYAERVMEKYGHQRGKGLGKHGQGIVEPVQASSQMGKVGLGFKLVYDDEKPEAWEVTVEETVQWIENKYPLRDSPSKETLRKWMREGPVKMKIDDEDKFCDAQILRDCIESKSVLDDIDPMKISKSKTRANPFETVGRGIFLNRAAMKMANIEKITDYMFTRPRDKSGREIIGDHDLLYFADVCAGPGGFSEYVFYRKKWRAKGFGFTLKGENDFRLEDFFAGPNETFEAHYGKYEDGDVCKPENIDSFADYVLAHTDDEGVHFMMADGGFELNDKMMQEIESKQLYLCQCLVALKIVRTEGNFVVKLFDVFTPFSVGLIYLMFRAFDRIAIHTPNSSRPANSERYLICQNKRADSKDICDHFFRVNELLCDYKGTNRDITDLVPFEQLQRDEEYLDYIVNSNNRIGERQVRGLRQLIKYSKNEDLCCSQQSRLKEECLAYWGIPNLARKDPKEVKPESKLRKLLSDDTKFLHDRAKKLTPQELSGIQSLHDWYWVALGSEEESRSLTFYLGLGRNNVYRLERSGWMKTQFTDLQLPSGTLVYGEVVQEMQLTNNLKSQYRVVAFHIVDGLFLGEENIMDMHITERAKCCEMFAKSLSNSKMVYRMKTLYELTSFELPSMLKTRRLKNGKECNGFHVEEKKFFIPQGVLLLCGTNAPWNSHISKKTSELYYFGCENKTSYWRRNVLNNKPRETKNREDLQVYDAICSSFKNTFKRRLIWMFDDNSFATHEGNPNALNCGKIKDFIQQKQ